MKRIMLWFVGFILIGLLGCGGYFALKYYFSPANLTSGLGFGLNFGNDGKMTVLSTNYFSRIDTIGFFKVGAIVTTDISQNVFESSTKKISAQSEDEVATPVGFKPSSYGKFISRLMTRIDSAKYSFAKTYFVDQQYINSLRSGNRSSYTLVKDDGVEIVLHIPNLDFDEPEIINRKGFTYKLDKNVWHYISLTAEFSDEGDVDTTSATFNKELQKWKERSTKSAFKKWKEDKNTRIRIYNLAADILVNRSGLQQTFADVSNDLGMWESLIKGELNKIKVSSIQELSFRDKVNIKYGEAGQYALPSENATILLDNVDWVTPNIEYRIVLVFGSPAEYQIIYEANTQKAKLGIRRVASEE